MSETPAKADVQGGNARIYICARGVLGKAFALELKATTQTIRMVNRRENTRGERSNVWKVSRLRSRRKKLIRRSWRNG